MLIMDPETEVLSWSTISIVNGCPIPRPSSAHKRQPCNGYPIGRPAKSHALGVSETHSLPLENMLLE